MIIMRRAAEMIPASFDPKRTISDFWVDPNTHVFDAVAFSPLPLPNTTLNFWTASPVHPAQGDWSTIADFLQRVICDGNAAIYQYLLNFLGHMIQKPEEKPGVMVVLLGGQGSGKGSFFSLLRALWPCSTLQVSDVEHVTTGFNAGLERAFAVCLDEAMFRGDRKALDRMKSLVTEPQITIEAKYQPRRTIDSFHRYFAASNHSHFAHVEPDDRRFLFLRVSAARQEDLSYFYVLHKAIGDPAAVAAMAYDLLHLDLSGFSVRRRPKTAEHTEQKLHSLEGFDRYWYEVLTGGCLVPDGHHGESWRENRFVASALLSAGYEIVNGGSRRFDRMTQSEIRKALERVCPDAKLTRRTQAGGQQRGYDLPSLSIARDAFSSVLGADIPWQRVMDGGEDRAGTVQ